MKPLDVQGINIFKQVELVTKLKEVVAVEDFGDELYICCSNEVIVAVKDEKARRRLAGKRLMKRRKRFSRSRN